jgi:ABC-type multidrug transport system permease subunit
MKHEIITTALTIVFFICNWLVDVFLNFESATNGFFSNFFNLNISQSYHVVWYISITVFVITLFYAHFLNHKLRIARIKLKQVKS